MEAPSGPKKPDCPNPSVGLDRVWPECGRKVPCGVWEAVYIIDGLLKNKANFSPAVAPHQTPVRYDQACRD